MRILALVIGLSFLAGCKLAVIAPPGGDITASDPAFNCDAGNLCNVDVVAASFSESFTAVPKPGYEFVKWAGGSGEYVCADSTNPVCPVSNLVLAGTVFESLVPADYVFYLQPVFSFVGIDSDGDGSRDQFDTDDDNDGTTDDIDPCPVNPAAVCQQVDETVVLNGKRWVSHTEVLGLSWNEIAAVCSPITGTCGSTGTLNGNDMSGWTWASLDDMSELFAALVPGFNLDTTVTDTFSETNAAWVDYLQILFNPTYSQCENDSEDTSSEFRQFGLVRNLSDGDPTTAPMVVTIDTCDSTFPDRIVFGGFFVLPVTSAAPTVAAYFYQAL